MYVLFQTINANIISFSYPCYGLVKTNPQYIISQCIPIIITSLLKFDHLYSHIFPYIQHIFPYLPMSSHISNISTMFDGSPKTSQKDGPEKTLFKHHFGVLYILYVIYILYTVYTVCIL